MTNTLFWVIIAFLFGGGLGFRTGKWDSKREQDDSHATDRVRPGDRWGV